MRRGQNPTRLRCGTSPDLATPARVFGLMPHPEHAVDPLTGSIDGLKLFESIRAHVADRVVA